MTRAAPTPDLYGVPVAALLALLSSLMWGTADFLGGATSRRRPALAVYGLAQVVGLAGLMIAATVSGSWADDPGYWPWGIAAGLIGIVSMVAFYEALALGPMGIVSPLVSLAVLVPLAFALLRGEQPTGAQTLGIILAVVGILLASGPEVSGAESARPLMLAVVAAVAFGAMFVLMAEGSKYSPVMTMTSMRIAAVVVLAVVALRLRSIGGVTWRDAPPIAGIGVLDAGANVAFGVATTIGLFATVSVLGSLYPVVTAVLAATLLAERLKRVQYVGVASAIIGVVLISSAA